MKYLIFGVIVFLVIVWWIRFAPSNPDRWHRVLEDPVDGILPIGVVRILEGRASQLDALENIIFDTPRTQKLKAADNGYTYVTRSALWGFPDYATVWTRGDDLIVYSRLRFGGGDMGINAKRVDAWIAALPTP